MRIVAWVVNDVAHDSRVLREAASLAAAGHEVTVMGVTAATDAPAPTSERRGGFTIVRVPLARGADWWIAWMHAPWRGVGRAFREAARAVGRQPARALGLVLLGVVALPWAALRAGWYGVVNRGLGHRGLGAMALVRHWQVRFIGWGGAALPSAPRADVHHAHDFETLPVAVRAARRDGGRVVYDSHEVFLAPGRTRLLPRWACLLLRPWERRLARRAAAVVTVNGAVADVLARRLGVPRIVVVHNAPPRWTPPAEADSRLRLAAGVPAGSPIALYHGGVVANRGIEQAIAAMLEPGLEAAHLVILGDGPAGYPPIPDDARIARRVHRLPAVDPADVVAWVSGADVDVMPIQPSDENKRLSTPNKLFESLAAGVPVVVSDFPAMAAIVAEDPLGPLGALCDPADPASIAAALRWVLGLPPGERAALRGRCLRAAHERWNWETEGAKLVELYAELASPG